MTRFVPVTVLVVLAASRVASAQGSGMLPGGATLAFDRLQLHEGNSETLHEPLKTPDSLWHYFNLAHCQCASPAGMAGSDFHETTFAYYITLQNPADTIGVPLVLYVGPTCSDPERIDLDCSSVTGAGLDNVDTLRGKNDFHPEIPLFQFLNAAPNPPATCTPTAARTNTLWATVDATKDGKPDYFSPVTITSDTLAPPLPPNIRARGSESGITLSWDAPTDTSDIYAYQALCAVADGDSPATTGGPDPLYDTASGLCGAPIAFELPGTDVADVPGQPPGSAVTLPDSLKNLDSTFLCGETVNPSTTALTVDGLTNGTAYKVVLLVMDKFGNATGTYFMKTVTPVPSTDFWEDLHDRGSNTEGGFCMVGRAPGSGGTLISVLGLIATAWWIRRRPIARRRRALPEALIRAVATVPVAVIALASGHVHAGGGYQPYWETNEDDESQTPTDDPGLIRWHAGIRIGPYVPEIDEQFGMSPGPYEQMFGGSRILPMLDVDRILWTGFGQLGIGISIGYMQKSAKTFTIESMPTDDMRARASDKNTFRLLPTALTATYRFTSLDDAYGIPLVPYVRGGLAYYVWWLSADGDLVCKDGGMPPDCARNEPRGGSLGFVGSIGLAIRAERIDPSTAMSMQQSGIQHAGIYGELSLAKVDGFGSETKLSVGDRTWFAGVNFEF